MLIFCMKALPFTWIWMLNLLFQRYFFGVIFKLLFEKLQHEWKVLERTAKWNVLSLPRSSCCTYLHFICVERVSRNATVGNLTNSCHDYHVTAQSFTHGKETVLSWRHWLLFTLVILQLCTQIGSHVHHAYASRIQRQGRPVVFIKRKHSKQKTEMWDDAPLGKHEQPKKPHW